MKNQPESQNDEKPGDNLRVGADMAEGFLSPSQARPKPPVSLVNSHSLQISPKQSRARSGEADP